MKLAEYDTMFNVEDRHWWYRHLRKMLRLFWSRHAPRPCLRLLDCGCGTGANLQAFQRECALATGLDFSWRAIELTRSRGLPVILQGDTQSLPFPDATYDVVFSCDILVNGGVTDPQAALHEIKRVLRPGGLLIINLAAYQWLLSSHDIAVHNVRRFTRPQVRAMLEKAGLQVLEATYWNTLLLPPIVLLRLLRKFQTREDSDLNDSHEGWAARVFSVLLEWELLVARRIPLPFGLSIMAAAQRPPTADPSPPTPSI